MDADSRQENLAHIGRGEDGWPGIRVTRFKSTRYWAIWIDGELLAVTLYKRGALAVRDRLLLAAAGPTQPKRAR